MAHFIAFLVFLFLLELGTKFFLGRPATYKDQVIVVGGTLVLALIYTLFTG